MLKETNFSVGITYFLRLGNVLVKLAFYFALATPADEIANATEISALITEWQDVNSICRDAMGAEDLDQTFGLGDQLAEQWNAMGLCQES